MPKIEKVKIEKPKIEKVKINKKKKRVNSKRGKKRPDFDTVLEPDDINPLDELEYPDDPSEMAEEEIGEVLQRILDQKAALKEKYRVNFDPEYYFVVCFQCRDQKEEFIQKAGWDIDGDKYIDGLELADELEIELTVYELENKVGVSPPKLLRKVAKIL